MKLLAGWAKRVDREPNYGTVSQAEPEGVLVSEAGLLRIDWPRLVKGGAAVDVDLLLVTANDPEITPSSPSYPTVEAIADAWNRGGEHVEYFWTNTDNGITTFQDNEISARLRSRQRSPNS